MENIKADILSFMAKLNAEVGHVLPMRPFIMQRVRGYAAPQQDLVKPALEALVKDGYLELRGQDYFLTQAGYDRLYPENMADVIAFVKADILDFLKSCQARVGHALAEKPYLMQRMQKYNPLQRNLSSVSL